MDPVEGGPCYLFVAAAEVLMRLILEAMGCKGTIIRAAVLLARSSKSSMVEAPGSHAKKTSYFPLIPQRGPYMGNPYI